MGSAMIAVVQIAALFVEVGLERQASHMNAAHHRCLATTLCTERLAKRGFAQVFGTGRVSDEAIMAGEVRPRALRKRQSRMKRLIVRQKAVKALVSAADAAAAADAVLAAAQVTFDELAQRLHVRSLPSVAL
jgi:hypothetical protein